MKQLLTCAALLGAMATAAASVPAQAQADDGHGGGGGVGVRVGTLSCHEAGGWGLIVGSSHRVRCMFIGNGDHGQPERYDGSISKFGVDLGYQQSAVIVWTVIAPTNHLGRGDLGGHYGGVTANVAVGLGAGANVLIGGFHRSVALQPVSFAGETGVNVAAGVGELMLRPHRDHNGNRDHDENRDHDGN